jgi:hypothetical protein
VLQNASWPLEKTKSAISADFRLIRKNESALYDRATHGIDCAYRKSFREMVSCQAHPDQPAAHLRTYPAQFFNRKLALHWMP